MMDGDYAFVRKMLNRHKQNGRGKRSKFVDHAAVEDFDAAASSAKAREERTMLLTEYSLFVRHILDSCIGHVRSAPPTKKSELYVKLLNAC